MTRHAGRKKSIGTVHSKAGRGARLFGSLEAAPRAPVRGRRRCRPVRGPRSKPLPQPPRDADIENNVGSLRPFRRPWRVAVNRRRVVWVYVLGVALAAVGAYPVLIGDYGPYDGRDLAAGLLLLIATPAAELLVVHVPIRKSAHSFSLLELPLTAGLMTAPPLIVIVAYGLGSAMVLVIHRRQPPLKLIFNTAVFVLTATVAVFVFGLQAHPSTVLSPITWGAVTVSVFVASLLGTVLVAGVISIAERRFDYRGLLTTILWGLATACGGISLGIATAILADQSLWSVAFITAPLLALFAANRAYESERQRRQSLQMVFDTSRTLTEESESETALFGVLARCHESLSSDAAAIYLDQGSETCLCLLVDERGQHRSVVPRAAVAPVFELAARHGGAWSIAGELTDGPGGVVLEAERRDLAGLLGGSGRSTVAEALVAPLVDGAGTMGLVVVASYGDSFRRLGKDQLALFETISRSIASHTRLSREANEDALTGLPNRRRLMQRLEAAFEEGRASRTVLMLVDLDDFKGINDTFGHAFGDGVLHEVARRLQRVMPDGWMAARLGGDEFAVLGETASVAHSSEVGEGALKILTDVVEVGGQAFQIRASMGLCLGLLAESPAALLRNADTALYEAKREGKGRLMVFNEPMHERAARRYRLGEALREALNRDQLTVVFQPVVSLNNGELVGGEALARWEHPEFGPVRPDEFVQIAEAENLSVQLATRVLALVVAGVRTIPGSLSISMNISPGDLADASFLAGLLDAATAVRPHVLGVEITERMLLSDQRIREVLGTVREAGIRVYVDDFGTGYSSLAYLKDLPADFLKIPREFVQDIEHGARNLAVVKGVVALGRALDLAVVAEGVESPEQRRLVTEAGAEFGQGYLFDVPLSLHEFRARVLTAETIARSCAA